ncbi:probable rRNA-processing protein EBP2 [Oppia nitens]|uniref:probable rRNA-processing protein EBP2 n=1 Tax=Oppia nitens TaxID=1686743 RepID=UPI0023DA7396|nr:probable rRNA-processing protein EBP2 [Oppia nitens]
MGRKKLLLDLQHRHSSDDSDSDDGLSVDSDEELQKAFAKGELKTGLNQVVALRPVEEHINDKTAMKAKLDQIRLDMDWIERLDSVDLPAKVTPEVQQMFGDIDLKLNKRGEIAAEDNELSDKADNDFKREMLFYRRAQTAVLEGIPRLKKLGIITKRPNDYFAEMAKNDDHMKKVRENLIRKQSAIEASDKAKKMRELKKYGKRIQTEVMLKRQKEKREIMNRLKKYKTGKDDNLNFLDNQHNDNQAGGSSSGGKGKGKQMKQNKKQKYKSARFGYGGQKKRSKYNSSNSSADMTKFSRNKHSKANSKGKARPGKSVRQRNRNKR